MTSATRRVLAAGWWATSAAMRRPALSTLSSWATLVATSRLPAYAIDDAYQDMVTLGLDVGDAWDACQRPSPTRPARRRR